MVTKSDKERGFKNKPIVDIVAVTSIGAINSAVLVSYVIENNTWEGSSERLNEFWEYLLSGAPHIVLYNTPSEIIKPDVRAVQYCSLVIAIVLA